MKSLFALLFLVFAAVMNAQGVCTINSTNANQNFRTICSQGSNPALVNGVFTGDLVVNSVSYTISSADLSAITFAKQVVVRTEFKSHLTFAQAPTVAQGTTVTAEFGKHVHSTITAYGITYQPNQSGRNYSDFANRMMAGATAIAPAPSPGPAPAPGGGGEAMLPITLLDWQANALRNGVEVRWSTTEEINNDYFIVEHSADGVNFAHLVQLPGAGSHRGTLNYAYRHATPVAGTNFYRLTQYDLDGTSTRFSVVSATAVGVEAASGVYPNPASPGRAVRLAAPTSATVSNLFYLDGRLAASLPVIADAELSLPATLPAGVYVLRVGNHSQRLLVR